MSNRTRFPSFPFTSLATDDRTAFTTRRQEKESCISAIWGLGCGSRSAEHEGPASRPQLDVLGRVADLACVRGLTALESRRAVTCLRSKFLILPSEPLNFSKALRNFY